MSEYIVLSTSYATTAYPGIVRLSVSPTSATIPIALGDNDPRVEKEAHWTFSWGDATPDTVYTFRSSNIINKIILSINTEFNGTGAWIKVGDDSYNDSLMTEIQNIPSERGIYETNPIKRYSTGDNIVLTLNPGTGATSGSGELLILF